MTTLSEALSAWPPVGGDDVPFTPTLHMLTAAFEEARRRGVRVMLTGLGGDLALHATGLEAADALREGDLTRLWRAAGGGAGASRATALCRVARASVPLWVPARWRAAWWRRRAPTEALAVLSPALRRAVIERAVERALPVEPAAAPDLATASLCAELGGWDGSFGPSQWTKLAACYGLELRNPFLDRRLVELLLTLPPSQRFGFERPNEKPVLRRAMAPRLPRSITERRGYTEFSSYVERVLLGPGAPDLDPLLAGGRLVGHGVVEPAAVRALLRRPAEHLNTVTELAAAELWLRRTV